MPVKTSKLKLTLNPGSDNYQYIVDVLDSVDDSQKKDSTSIAMPGQSYKNNILMSLSGQESDITIQFNIHDDGTDKADGTYSSTVVTISEQIDYIKNEIQAPEIGSSWTLVDENGIYGDYSDPANGLNVAVNKINVATYSKDERKWRSCRIDLTVGEVIA